MVKREFGVAAPDGEVEEVFEEAMMVMLQDEGPKEKIICGLVLVRH